MPLNTTAIEVAPRTWVSPYARVAIIHCGFALCAALLVYALPSPLRDFMIGLMTVSLAIAMACALLHLVYWTTKDVVSLVDEKVVIDRFVCGRQTQRREFDSGKSSIQLVRYRDSMYPFPLIEMRSDLSVLWTGYGLNFCALSSFFGQLQCAYAGTLEQPAANDELRDADPRRPAGP